MAKQKIIASGFAGINPHGSKPYIMTWSVRATAKDARRAIGANWNHIGDDDEGWKVAKHDGIRVRRVTITAI